MEANSFHEEDKFENSMKIERKLGQEDADVEKGVKRFLASLQGPKGAGINSKCLDSVLFILENILKVSELNILMNIGSIL